MKRVLIVILLFNGLISVYSQQVVHYGDSLGYDSLNREQGYWKLPTVLNLVRNGKFVRSIEGWEFGYFVDGKKEGCWSVKNEESEIIGHRIYQKDMLLYQIQYDNKKAVSIIGVKYIPVPPNNKGINGYEEPVDIISFNRCGKVKQRTYYTLDGEIITEKY